MSSDVPEEFRPRLCHIVKWHDFPGYGFNLHAEKGKAGQFIGQVDDGSPAQAGGLKEGDRIVEVNGANIGSENHQQVVGRIKAGGEETRLLVVDNESDEYYKEQKKVVRGDLPEVRSLTASRDVAPEPQPEPEVEPEPEPQVDTEAFTQSVAIADNGVEEEAPATNGDASSDRDSLYRPRLCHLKMWPHFQGYGFNLHAERDKPGQYIGLVDDGSPAQAAGLIVNDRIVEVNGVNVEGQDHPDVIARIKSVPNETRLLVVDRDVDAYYKERGITVHSGLPQVDSKSADLSTDATEDAVVVDGENGVEEAAVPEPEQEIEVAQVPEVAEIPEVAEVPEVPAQEEVVEAAVEEPVEASQEAAVVEAAAHEEVVVEPIEANVAEQVEELPQAVVEEEVSEEPVNGVSSVPEPAPAPIPEPEPEFAVAPTPAPLPTPAPSQPDNTDGLELNLTVAEMKERLKARKKQDPRSSKLSFEQKYKDFQRM